MPSERRRRWHVTGRLDLDHDNCNDYFNADRLDQVTRAARSERILTRPTVGFREKTHLGARCFRSTRYSVCSATCPCRFSRMHLQVSGSRVGEPPDSRMSVRCTCAGEGWEGRETDHACLGVLSEEGMDSADRWLATECGAGAVMV